MATIGTHSGTFHCDEALACFMLKKTEAYNNATITRSRVDDVLSTLDILVDVGSVYDPSTHRYDHHQKGFTETFDDRHHIKLSSAGLVYKHFGREVVAAITSLTGKDLENVYQKGYSGFIKAIDAIDNGVNMVPDGVDAPYHVSTDLSSRVKQLNPDWNEYCVDITQCFESAMALAGGEFESYLLNKKHVWLPAREVVERAVWSCTEVDPSRKIIVLDTFVPWQSHLSDLEKELGLSILYVIFKDTSGSYRVRATRESKGSFNSRKALPKVWRGLRNEVLDAVVGIQGCIFVHGSGFIGGHTTLEGAVQMARLAVDYVE